MTGQAASSQSAEANLPANFPAQYRSPLAVNTSQTSQDRSRILSPGSPLSAVSAVEAGESRFRSNMGMPKKLDLSGTNSAPASPIASSTNRFKPVAREPQCEIHSMSSRELQSLLSVGETGSGSNSLLLIDVRPYTMYSFTHIRGAISICIPSTLLKRQTFGFRKIMDFVAPQDVDTLNSASERSHIVFYDQATSVCAPDSTLRRTAAKFVDADAALAPKLHYLVGGLADISKEAPELIDAGEDLLASLPSSLNPDNVHNHASESTLLGDAVTVPIDETPRLTLSSVKSVPRSPFSLMPVVTTVGAGLRSPVHSPSRNKPPLDESSSIHVDGEIASRLPEFPQWLVNAVKLTECGKNVLAESFQRLQAAEIQRVTPSGMQREPKSARLLSPRFRVFTPRSTPTTPYSDTSMHSSQSVSSTNTSPMFAVDSSTVYSQKGQHVPPSSGQMSPRETTGDQFVLVAGDDPRKNRYTNIAPFGYNRVMVRGTEYLNASYIRSRLSPLQYIATQAPVPASFGDFWWCVYEQKVPLIVMLTTLRTESGQVKGNKYWFDSEYDGLKVKLIEEHEENRNRRPSNGMFSSATNASIDASTQSSGLIVRTLHLTSPDGDTHNVIQVQYENWPDLGCPSDPNEVLDLVEFKKSILKNVDESSNIIVHCSAGCGRTGTFCTIDTVTDYLSRLKWPEIQQDPKDRVLEVVGEFREQRMAMVQNQRQLLLCYQGVMLWYLGRLEGEPS